MKKILGVLLLLVIQVLAKDGICYYPKSCYDFTFYSDVDVKLWYADYNITVVCHSVSKVYKKRYRLTYKIKNSKDIRLKIIPIKWNKEDIQCFYKKSKLECVLAYFL